MADNRIIFIGEKESFILRVLNKKVREAGGESEFVHWSVNEINKSINSDDCNVALVALFMEENEPPAQDVLHFLTDILEEKGLKIVLVGEQNDINDVLKQIKEELIYKVFPRPVDNAEFAGEVMDYLTKVASGEFKRSILVVDDDPQYLTMVRDWLKETYRVSMANSGLQAIKWLARNKVDLILLDHEMPVTSGPQVLEMLRSEPETASIPVMFLTGKGDKESVMSVVELRPEGYFLKGIQKAELLEKLQEYFILHK